MAVKITKIRGATQREIEEKKFNIYVAISLGNKWFTKDHIKQYVLWALKYSKGDVVILIGDSLQAINYEVISRYSPKKALSRSLRAGSEMESLVEGLKDSLSKNTERIVIVKWSDIETGLKYKKMLNSVFEEFDKNITFKEEVLNIIKSFLNKPSLKKRNFNSNQIRKLSEYVLRELPLFLDGFYYKETHYNLHPYPVPTEIADLAQRIIETNEFPKLKKEIKHGHAIVDLEIK